MTSQTPVLHLLAGPNGAGKTTFYEHVQQTEGLPCAGSSNGGAEL